MNIRKHATAGLLTIGVLVALPASLQADNLAYMLGTAALGDQNPLGTVDLNTGVFTLIGNMGSGGYGGLAVANGVLYTEQNGLLYSVNTSNANVTLIGGLIGNNFATFGSTTTGLYGLAGSGPSQAATLFSINPQTGAIATIGPIGASAIPNGQGYYARFSVGSSTLYMEFQSNLYTINTTTGAATQVGTTDTNGYLTSIPLFENGTYYDGAGSNLATINVATGQITPGSTISGGPGSAVGLAPDPLPAGTPPVLPSANAYLLATAAQGVQNPFGIVDLNSGAFTLIGNMGSGGYDGLAVVNGALYTEQNGLLYSVNTANANLTLIGGVTGTPNLNTFGSTTTGLYGVAGAGALEVATLFSINPQTGAITAIGPIGAGAIPDGQSYYQRLSVGSSTLYLEANSNLYTVNTTTGAATQVGTTDSNGYLSSVLIFENGTYYAGEGSGIATINIATGQIDPHSSIFGAAGTPVGLAPIPSTTGNPASQTITFGALSNVTLGIAPFAIGATASSGLAVTFASTTAAVCTVSGSTVTIVAVGTCSIVASQAGDADYTAASSVPQSFTVSTTGLSAGGAVLPASGGSGSVNLTFMPGFAWTAVSSESWLTLTGFTPAGSNSALAGQAMANAGVQGSASTAGTGSGTLTFQVAANAGPGRSATITVAGFIFTVEQQASSISGLSFIGSMPHLAAEENWTTSFTLVNKSASSATARLSFFGDVIDPSGNGPLTLPVTFPQQASVVGPLLAASFDQALAANASLLVITAGPQTPPVLVGSAQLAAPGAVDGFAIFHQIVTTQEAVVPLETRNASSYLLAFDNTGGVVLGVAVENISTQNAVIPVVIRDDTGVVISAPGSSITLGGNGHTSFVLSTQFPVTANLRGTIEFDTPAGGQIGVLGLRFTPPNNALTTIPALANVSAGGGSIAHLASGGDGWQTTFALVNTGTIAAQMTLSFFADITGLPVSLPLSFPQSGGGNVTMAPSVTQTLAAGATLLIVSSGAPQLITGSAQLTTAGNISGFVIFRHNGQEAVVPLESRNAGAYLIAFDNTNGTATGIAVNAVSAGQVNIPVTVRDTTGATIATDTITLNANGHTQFTLVTDRYPMTANIQGTIEFDTPAGAQIGALGIRIPNVPAHTYTTLPALAK